MNRAIIIISLFYLINSCNNDVSFDKTLKVEINNKDNITQNDFFKTVNIQQLETSDSSIINKAEKILIHNDHLYVLDRKQNAVLVFYLNGVFIRRIQNIGRGPGEYSILQDVCINKYKNELNLLSVNSSKIIILDLLGNYIDEYKLPSELIAARYFEPVDSMNYLIFTREAKHQLYLYSIKKRKIISGFLNEVSQDITDNTYLNLARSPFFRNGDTVKYFQVYTNNIYAFVNEDIIPDYSWDFGEYNFNYKKDLPKDKNKYKDYLKKNSNKFVFYFISNLENSKIHYTAFLYDKYIYNAIYIKENNSYKLFDRFDEGYYLSPSILFLNEKTLYSLISPMSFKNYFEKTKYYYENELNKIDLFSNPVLIKYQLKHEYY